MCNRRHEKLIWWYARCNCIRKCRPHTHSPADTFANLRILFLFSFHLSAAIAVLLFVLTASASKSFGDFSFSWGYLCLPNEDEPRRRQNIQHDIATKEKKTFCLLLLMHSLARSLARSQRPFRQLQSCRQNKILLSFSYIERRQCTLHTVLIHRACHLANGLCTVRTSPCTLLLLHTALQPYSWICNSAKMCSNLWKPKAKFYRRKETRKTRQKRKRKLSAFVIASICPSFVSMPCIQWFAMTRYTVILSISFSLPLSPFLLVSFQLKWAFPKQISALDTV